MDSQLPSQPAAVPPNARSDSPRPTTTYPGLGQAHYVPPRFERRDSLKATPLKPFVPGVPSPKRTTSATSESAPPLPASAPSGGAGSSASGEGGQKRRRVEEQAKEERGSAARASKTGSSGVQTIVDGLKHLDIKLDNVLNKLEDGCSSSKVGAGEDKPALDDSVLLEKLDSYFQQHTAAMQAAFQKTLDQVTSQACLLSLNNSFLQNTITELEASLKAQEEQLKTIKLKIAEEKMSSMAAIKQQEEKYQIKLEHRDAVVSTLRDQLVESQNVHETRLSTASDEIDRLTHMIHQEQQLLDDAAEDRLLERADKEKELESLCLQLKAAQDALAEAEKSGKDRADHVVVVIKEKQVLEAVLGEKEIRATELRDGRLEVERELAETQQKLRTANAAVRRLEMDLQNQKRTVDNQSDMLAAAAGEARDLRSRVEKAKSDVEYYRKARNTAHDKLASLKDEKTDLVERNDALSLRVATLERDLSVLTGGGPRGEAPAT
ncbi:hypothetical protein Rhopal_006770-T1 [Rhodotorula paludigena]|uniref:Uncharacterized protein n=1 Tax=Rhodotorula paludigena TaxID=86838 RepID=A0AAV5GYZ0_9BASI|nr:hypothetical protein Rhopal_006770-T1 [Rhodotorula paludigena]